LKGGGPAAEGQEGTGGHPVSIPFLGRNRERISITFRRRLNLALVIVDTN
jgi:hypothetical protein